jgi:hypothetical protein
MKSEEPPQGLGSLLGFSFRFLARRLDRGGPHASKAEYALVRPRVAHGNAGSKFGQGEIEVCRFERRMGHGGALPELNRAILRRYTQKLHRQKWSNFIEAEKRPLQGDSLAQATGKRLP